MIDAATEIGGVLTAWAHSFLDSVDPDQPLPNGNWEDLRNDDGEIRNAILDSEILLIFLLPETQLRGLRFDNESRGGSKDLQNHPLYRWFHSANPGAKTFSYWNQRVCAALKSYYLRNSAADGTPTFGSNSYFTSGADKYATIPVPTVDAYSLSLSVSLMSKQLCDRVAAENRDEDEQEYAIWAELSELASKRITAALQGLLNSFCVETSKQDVWEQNTGRKWPEASGGSLNKRSRDRLMHLRQELKGMGFKIPTKSAYEVGWSWGPTVRDIGSDHTNQAPLAEPAPYLYFTINALDGIVDLETPQVESGGLLSPEQLALAAQLKTRARMTATYWMAVTTAHQSKDGPGEWEIETLPWRTADGQGTLYWNLYLTRVILSSGSLSEPELLRFTALAERLGEAARVTTPAFPTESDPSVRAIHYPGLQIELNVQNTDQGQELEYLVLDFAPQLLKLVGRLLSLTTETATRQRLLDLADRVWKHLTKRAAGSSVGKSWDSVISAFPEFAFGPEARGALGIDASKAGVSVNSWYLTERVLESLTMLASVDQQRPRSSNELKRFASLLIVEAEWYVNQATADDRLKLRGQLDAARRHNQNEPALSISHALRVIDKAAGET
jgi:hypothetical protein